jgi:hypothetical protein
MAIHVVYAKPGYRVSVSPPDASSWSSDGPMSARRVLAELSRRGCHSADTSDALYAADPEWGEHIDDE